MTHRPETAWALVEATRNAVVAAGEHVGSGDRNAVDGAAVRAIHETLRHHPRFSGVVVLGEGHKDNAPTLPHGKGLGRGPGPRVAVGLDPIEGTGNAANGHGSSYSIMMVSPEGTMLPWDDDFPYTNRLSVGPEAADLFDRDLINIQGDPEDVLRTVAKALGKRPENLVVAILDRERNTAWIAAARRLGIDGKKLRLPKSGDLEHGILTFYDPAGNDNFEVDVSVGIGGTPEAALLAGAHQALGRGAIQAMRYAHTDRARARLREMDPHGQVLTASDLVGAETTLVATGLTGGPFLSGGRQSESGLWLPGETVIMTQGQQLNLE